MIPKKKRIDKIQKQRMIEHISSVKVVESHKVRNNDKFWILPKVLEFSELHRLFLKFCKGQSYEKVNFDFNKSICRQKFCLSFNNQRKIIVILVLCITFTLSFWSKQ